MTTGPSVDRVVAFKANTLASAPEGMIVIDEYGIAWQRHGVSWWPSNSMTCVSSATLALRGSLTVVVDGQVA